MKTQRIAAALKRKRQREQRENKEYVSTGSTILNCAMTGHAMRGFKKGHYYLFVGDTKSGKTFFTLTCLAEASINPNFKDYRFIHDDSERGALMNKRRFFGRELARRIEPPNVYEDGTPAPSSTIEEFYFNINNAFKQGDPFIYVLDSLDVLSSEFETRTFEKQQREHEEGKALSAAMTDGKAKQNSAVLRKLITPLQDTGSILIVINQTRDVISSFGFKKKGRSGGRTPVFYATIILWSSVKQSIRKTIQGKPRILGTLSQVKVEKNRVSGKEHTVEIPIYSSFGIDDIGSCINYLIAEGHWKQTRSMIEATDWEIKMTHDKLIKYIEDECLEARLRRIVGRKWRSIEKACEDATPRKKRYE